MAWSGGSVDWLFQSRRQSWDHKTSSRVGAQVRSNSDFAKATSRYFDAFKTKSLIPLKKYHGIAIAVAKYVQGEGPLLLSTMSGWVRCPYPDFHEFSMFVFHVYRVKGTHLPRMSLLVQGLSASMHAFFCWDATKAESFSTKMPIL